MLTTTFCHIPLSICCIYIALYTTIHHLLPGSLGAYIILYVLYKPIRALFTSILFWLPQSLCMLRVITIVYMPSLAAGCRSIHCDSCVGTAPVLPALHQVVAEPAGGSAVGRLHSPTVTALDTDHPGRPVYLLRHHHAPVAWLRPG